jgi:hypothetical protein
MSHEAQPEKWLRSLKDKRVIAVVVFMCMIVIGLGTFTDAAVSLRRFFFAEEKAPEVIGASTEWRGTTRGWDLIVVFDAGSILADEAPRLGIN